MLFLLFELDRDRYALDIAQVIEVLPLVDLKQIPPRARRHGGAFQLPRRSGARRRRFRHAPEPAGPAAAEHAAGRGPSPGRPRRRTAARAHGRARHPDLPARSRRLQGKRRRE